MADQQGNGTRVTMRMLNDSLNLVRQEQKTEHAETRAAMKSEDWKTRLLVVILAAPNVAKALPYVLGYFGWHLW